MATTIDTEHARRWVESYLATWTSNDRADIEALFTPDASYRYRPYADPVVGRDKIVATWLENKDDPGTWTANLQPLVVSGDLAVVTGTVDYEAGPVYSNLWVIRFGDDGRCSEFTEWYMDRSA
jgi:ketosteroid isomerase-like protein